MKTTQTLIPEVSAEQLMQGEFLGKQIRIHGSIYKIRKMSGFAFVLLRTKREIIQCVYGEFSNFALSELSEESCVIFTADVVKEERSKTGFELRLRSVEILSTPAAELPIVIHNKLVDNRCGRRCQYFSNPIFWEKCLPCPKSTILQADDGWRLRACL